MRIPRFDRRLWDDLVLMGLFTILMLGGCPAAPNTNDNIGGTSNRNRNSNSRANSNSNANANDNAANSNDNSSNANANDNSGGPGTGQPQIRAISDASIFAGQDYVGPTPRLITPMLVAWRLEEAPEGMTINDDTGVVRWNDATLGNHVIVIAAFTGDGIDTETWQLSVVDEVPEPTIEPASVGTDGSLPNNASSNATISSDGRWITFLTRASNVVEGDDEVQTDVFLHDRVTGTTLRASSVNGEGGDQPSGGPSVSPNGRFVAFRSFATNLVEDDVNEEADVFVFDRSNLSITRRSVGSGGVEANGSSDEPALSTDARYVVFQSSASNLVPGDTNDALDIFRHDRVSDTTVRVSVSSTGEEGNGPSVTPAISADGRFVVFASLATNLSANDTNEASDIFLRDLQLGTTTIISVGTGGAAALGGSHAPRIAGAESQFIVFESAARNLVVGDSNNRADVFLFDRSAGVMILISTTEDGRSGNGPSSNPDVSDDGTVVFVSTATNLLAAGNSISSIYYFDPAEFVMRRLSENDLGGDGNGPSIAPAISADGEFAVFESKATNLVPNDDNNHSDIVVKDLFP